MLTQLDRSTPTASRPTLHHLQYLRLPTSLALAQLPLSPSAVVASSSLHCHCHLLFPFLWLNPRCPLKALAVIPSLSHFQSCPHHHHQQQQFMRSPFPVTNPSPLLLLLLLLLRPQHASPMPKSSPPLASHYHRLHSSSNARGQNCNSSSSPQAAESAAVAGEAAGVRGVLMRDPELRMYAGVGEAEPKSSAADTARTTTITAAAAAVPVAAAAVVTTEFQTPTTTTNTTTTTPMMITMRIPPSSTLSHSSPPLILSPSFSTTPPNPVSLSSSLASTTATAGSAVLPVTGGVTMKATTSSTVADTATFCCPTSPSRMSSLPPVSSLLAIPLSTTTMMVMTSPSSLTSTTSSLGRSAASVQNWFQSELDLRGIESVYSRYVISLLLQQDKDNREDVGVCGVNPRVPADSLTVSITHSRREPVTVATSNQSQTAGKGTSDEPKGSGFCNNTKSTASGTGLPATGLGTIGRRHRGAGKKERLPLTEEESKKREAVKCLLEVCDDVQAGGIEKLIEELMTKLKDLDKKESPRGLLYREEICVTMDTSESVSKTGKQDPAERYYAAFPALSTDQTLTTSPMGSPSSLVPGSDISNVWKKKQLQQQQYQPIPTTKADSKLPRASSLHRRSASSSGRSGTPVSLPPGTKDAKLHPRGRRSGSTRRRSDSASRLSSSRGTHSHHGNKENVHKRTEGSGLAGRYGMARNRQRNAGVHPLNTVSVKQAQQRTVGGSRNKACRTLTYDIHSETQHATSGKSGIHHQHHHCQQLQQPLNYSGSGGIGSVSGGGNGTAGCRYGNSLNEYNKSNAFNDSEGQNYCIIVENILKDILLTSNEKPSSKTEMDSGRHLQHVPGWPQQQATKLWDQQRKLCHLRTTTMTSQGFVKAPDLSTDLSSSTGSSPLFLLDELDYSYYDQSVSDIQWSSSGKDPVHGIVGEAFREDSSWYESNFEDPFDAVHCSSIASTSAVSIAPFFSTLTSRGRMRARLYKRHSYHPPSPSSLVNIQSYEPSSTDKTDHFSMSLGLFVDVQPPTYSSEKEESGQLPTLDISGDSSESCQLVVEDVLSPGATTDYNEKDLMTIDTLEEEEHGQTAGDFTAASVDAAFASSVNTDGMATTAITSGLWPVNPVSSSNRTSLAVGCPSLLNGDQFKSRQDGDILPISKGYNAEYSTYTTAKPTVESIWSFPGHPLADLQPLQSSASVTSVVQTTMSIPNICEKKISTPGLHTTATAITTTTDSVFTSTSILAPRLLSTSTSNSANSFGGATVRTSANTLGTKAITSSCSSSTVNTPLSSSSPCSTSSLSLVDLSYLTHIGDYDHQEAVKPNDLNANTRNDLKDINDNDDDEIYDSLSNYGGPLAGGMWGDIGYPNMSGLIRSPVLTPGHYPGFYSGTHVTAAPDGHLAAMYKKLGPSLSAEMLAQANQGWPEQMVFGMRIMQPNYQLGSESPDIDSSKLVSTATVAPVVNKSTVPSDIKLIGQIWCNNNNNNNDSHNNNNGINNFDDWSVKPDHFFTKNDCLSQLWNINFQRKLAMSSQTSPHCHPHGTIGSCSYTQQQSKPAVSSSALFVPAPAPPLSTTPLFSSNSSSKITSLPPISSLLHDAAPLFSPISIFPSAGVIANSNSSHHGNRDSYFYCDYYSFYGYHYGFSPSGPLYHHQSWPSSSSFFSSPPLLSPPLSNSSLMFPLAPYTRDFCQKQPVKSLPVKVLPTLFVPQMTEGGGGSSNNSCQCPSLIVIKDEEDFPASSCSDGKQGTSETLKVNMSDARTDEQTRLSVVPTSYSTTTTTTTTSSVLSSSSSSSSTSSSSSVVAAVTSPSSSSSTVSSTSPCLSSSSSPSSLLQAPAIGPSRAFELVPSKFSAFKDVIPRKQAVMAELASAQNSSKYGEDSQGKTVTEEEELMRQASPAVSPREMLYFSPRTHFRPIKTPPAVSVVDPKVSGDGTTNIAAGASSSLLVSVRDLGQTKTQHGHIDETISTIAPVLYQPPDLFGGHPESKSPYQDFHQAGATEGKTDICNQTFVPKFRLQKNTDKYIQTGQCLAEPCKEPQQGESLKSTQLSGANQLLAGCIVDYDLERLAEEVCSEDGSKDSGTVADIGLLSFGQEPNLGSVSDSNMTLCVPHLGLSSKGSVFSTGDSAVRSSSGSVWSYNKLLEPTGGISTPSAWCHDSGDDTAANMLGLMASDPKKHYPKTWSRGSDEIQNWAPVAPPEVPNWTPMAPLKTWPTALSSSTSSCSSVPLDPNSHIQAYSHPTSIVDGAMDADTTSASTIGGQRFKEERWPSTVDSSATVSVAATLDSCAGGALPTFTAVSVTSSLPSISLPDTVCPQSELWQQQGAWMTPLKELDWPLPVPPTTERIGHSMWESNDGCGDAGADHWVLESPGSESHDWTPDMFVPKTPGRQVWAKPNGAIAWPLSKRKDDAMTTTATKAAAPKSWLLDSVQLPVNELGWSLDATSELETTKAKNSSSLEVPEGDQLVWQDKAPRYQTSTSGITGVDIWSDTPLFGKKELLSTKPMAWPQPQPKNCSSSDTSPSSSPSIAAAELLPPPLPPLSVGENNTWPKTSLEPFYWSTGNSGDDDDDDNDHDDHKDKPNVWLPLEPTVQSYSKIHNENYHNERDNTDNVKSGGGSSGGRVDDNDNKDNINNNNDDDDNVNENKKNKDNSDIGSGDCFVERKVNPPDTKGGGLCERETEWSHDESAQMVDWSYSRDKSVALSWPSPKPPPPQPPPPPLSQAPGSCTGEGAAVGMALYRCRWHGDFALTTTSITTTTTSATTVATGAVATRTDRGGGVVVAPTNTTGAGQSELTEQPPPHGIQMSTDISAAKSCLTPNQTDKSVAVSSSSSSRKVASLKQKGACPETALEPLMPLPCEAVYSCELEKEWLKSEYPVASVPSSQQLRGKQHRGKLRSLKKPCSFFLEGNCRRTECKYAHDISNITCRFWEDGECFKGDTCPFLHGYCSGAEGATPGDSSRDSENSPADNNPTVTCTTTTILRKNTRDLTLLPQSNVTTSPDHSQPCSLVSSNSSSSTTALPPPQPPPQDCDTMAKVAAVTTTTNTTTTTTTTTIAATNSSSKRVGVRCSNNNNNNNKQQQDNTTTSVALSSESPLPLQPPPPLPPFSSPSAIVVNSSDSSSTTASSSSSSSSSSSPSTTPNSPSSSISVSSVR